MRHILPFAVSALSLLMLSSCTGEPLSGLSVETDRTAIAPEVTIENTVPATKAPVLGTSFPDGGTYALWICNGGTFTEFNERTNNMKATYASADNSWSYAYDGIASSFTNIIVRKDEDEEATATLDLYAYAPFISGTKDLSAIAFTASDQQDLMYALENNNDTNKGKQLSGQAIISVFRFHHALSLVEFRVKNKNSGSTINVSNIWIKSSGATQIYTKGSFNAVTGAITGNTPGAVTLGVNPNSSGTPQGINITSTSDCTSIYMLVIPTECQGDDLTMGFTMDAVGGPDSGLNSFPVSRDDLKHGDGVTYGFRAGYRYVFNVDIDNYVHLTGVQIDREWTALEMPEKII